MKKFGFITVVTLLLASCGQGQQTSETAMQQERDSLQRIINEKDMELNDIMSTFDEVQEGIRRINEAEGRVTIADAAPESASSKEVIRENMQFINETMSQNKELINKLRLRLRDSNTASDQLRKTLENLTAQLEAKESELAVLREELEAKDIHIAELDEQVTQLNEDVTQLKDDKVKKEETISQQDKELNTAWYVFGTKRELKEQKILQSGEVLQGNFNKDYFTKIDIRVDKEIRLMSRDAKLLTNHPASSYTLERDANKQYVLRITNPQQFWSTSKYLVVLVK